MNKYALLGGHKKNILEERLDILLALGTSFRAQTFPAIEDVFQENPAYYHELAQEVVKKDPELFRNVFVYPVEMDRKTRQMIGIIEHVNRHPEDVAILDRILNKGFQSVKKYASNATPEHTFEQYYIKKYKHERSMDMTQVIAESAVALYYGKRYDRSLGFGEVTVEMLIAILEPQNYYDKSVRFLDENEEVIKSFFEAYGIPFPVKNKKYTVIGLLTSIDKAHSNEFAFQQRMIKDRLSAVGDFYDTTYIDSSIINARETLTGEEILVCAQSALEHLSLSQDDNGQGLDELLLFINNLYTRIMSTLYDRTKELANVTSQEEMLLREKNLQKEYDKREKKILKELDTSRREEVRYKDLYERSLKENDKLKKQIGQLEQKAAKQASHEQEIVGLRNFLYQQQTEETPAASSINVNDMTAFLQEHSFAIFGGHPNFTQKLKELLPGVRFIAPDDQNKSFKFVSNLNVLFVFTDYFNHGTYYKLLKSIGEQTRLVYLPKNVNIELTIQYMYEAFQD